MRLSCLLVLCSIVQAQVPLCTFGNIDSDDGLSQNSVWAVVQDSMDVIWVATGSGLNRLDGTNIKIYKHRFDDDNSLSDNQIRHLMADSNGMIWASTANGLNQLDPSNDTITRFNHQSDDEHSLSFSYIYCTIESEDGQIWVGTREGLNLLDPVSGRAVRLMHDVSDPSSISHNTIRSLAMDSAGNLWVGTFAGLNCLRRGQAGFERYQWDPNDVRSLSNDQVRAVHVDGQDRVWAGTSSGLNRLDPNGFVRFKADQNNLSDDWINAITSTNRYLWLATFRGGLVRMDLNSGKFTSYVVNSHNTSVSENDMVSVFVDRSQLLWAGTFTHGVDTLDTNPPKFLLYGTPDLDRLRGARAVHEDSQRNLYVGCQSGLHIFLSDNEYDFLSRTSTPSLSEEQVLSVATSASGEIWVGTYSGGLNLISPGLDKVDVLRHDATKPSISSDFVYAVLEAPDGAVLLGTRAGIDRVNSLTRQVEHIPFPDQDELNDVDRLVHCLFFDSEQRLWAGTEKGACLMTGSFKRYDIELSSLKTMCFAEDQRSRLWIGTGHGLNCVEPDGAIWSIGVQDGLDNDTIYSILPATSDVLWLSTNGGLVRLTVSERSFDIELFDVSSGIQGNDFFDNTGLIRQSGEFLFGGVNGLNGFDPSNIERSTWPPNIVLTGFSVFGESKLRGTAAKGVFVLDHKSNQMTIEFAALDYRQPSGIQYLTMLEGFDSHWRSPTGPYASYSNLPYRDYVFRVRATNSDGVWSDHELAVSVTIQPPYYQAGWFRALLVGLVLLSLPLIHRLRVRNVRRQNTMMMQLVGERTAELDLVHQKLVDAAHRAGILQIANGVLNQVTCFLADFKRQVENIQGSLHEEALANLHQWLNRFHDWLSDPQKDPSSDLIEDLDRVSSSIALQQEQSVLLLKELFDGLRKMQETIRIQHHYGFIPIHLEAIELRSVLKETLDLMAAELASQQVEVMLNCPEISECAMSKIKLNQLITELIKNSVEAMSEADERKITITARESGASHIEIDITDTGPGISRQHSDDVFRYGFTTKPGHVGYGLHHVANIVTELGGQIKHDYTTKSGCRFLLTLPKKAGI